MGAAEVMAAWFAGSPASARCCTDTGSVKQCNTLPCAYAPFCFAVCSSTPCVVAGGPSLCDVCLLPHFPCRRRYSRALQLLLTAITAPTMVVNAITVACLKKYVLISLLHTGMYVGVDDDQERGQWRG